MTSNLPPFLRGYLGFLLMLCLVVVGLAAVTILDPDAGQRRERVDTLASGPYFVEKVVNSSPAYLAFVNTERHKISPHIVETWTGDLGEAYRFGAWDSARDEAQRVGGRVVSLREIRG